MKITLDDFSLQIVVVYICVFKFVEIVIIMKMAQYKIITNKEALRSSRDDRFWEENFENREVEHDTLLVHNIIKYYWNASYTKRKRYTVLNRTIVQWVGVMNWLMHIDLHIL